MKPYRTRRSRQPTNEHVLSVDEGQVMCPRRGIVDIEVCWMCSAYRGMSGGSAEGLVCGNEAELMPTALRSATA
jgi:sulfur relay (sulfurtransferase) complex TusBCD TusD component (DsrE family)